MHVHIVSVSRDGNVLGHNVGWRSLYQSRWPDTYVLVARYLCYMAWTTSTIKALVVSTFATRKISTPLTWQLSFQPIKSHTGQQIYTLVRSCQTYFNWRRSDWSPYSQFYHRYHKISESKWRYPCSYQQSSLQSLKALSPALFNSDNLNASSSNVAKTIHPALMDAFATQLDIVETHLEYKKL